jgi:hypothetical protein
MRVSIVRKLNLQIVTEDCGTTLRCFMGNAIVCRSMDNNWRCCKAPVWIQIGAAETGARGTIRVFHGVLLVPWIAYGWYTKDARTRFSALEVDGGVWLIGRFHCFSWKCNFRCYETRVIHWLVYCKNVIRAVPPITNGSLQVRTSCVADVLRVEIQVVWSYRQQVVSGRYVISFCYSDKFGRSRNWEWINSWGNVAFT